MTDPGERTLDLAAGPAEVVEWTGRGGGAPIVLLHEGLGSARLWRTFPETLAAATGRAVFAWSRHGYGRSAPAAQPRQPGYMHDEALVVLPEVLDHLQLEKPVLLGHSDGASIALIHAGAGHAVTAIVAIAPHVIVEEESLSGIRLAKERFETTDMPVRMARHHRDAESTFRGWNDVWLSGAFRDWNIEEYLPGISAPVLAVQAADDEYGTPDQLARIEAGVRGRFERLVLADGGHSPHLTRPAQVLEAIVGFLRTAP